MFSVRFHGRGGQGVVTAAELLAAAAFGENRHAQAFPSFGPERMGAPVTSFCRIGEYSIRTHEPVTEPDAIIVQDPTLLRQQDLFAGLSADGYVLVNSAQPLHDLSRRFSQDRLAVIPASFFATKFLGRPLPGAAMLGGFAALTGTVGIDGVVAAIRERFTGKVAEGNIGAAHAAYAFVLDERKAMTSHA